MLYGPFVEGSKREINLGNVDPEVFKSLLKYIYTGTVEINISNMVPLIGLVQQFWISPAESEFYKAARHLIEQLDTSDGSISQVLSILTDSYNLNIDSIKEICLEYVDLFT